MGRNELLHGFYEGHTIVLLQLGFIHSLSKHELNVSSALGPILGLGASETNKTQSLPL